MYLERIVRKFCSAYLKSCRRKATYCAGCVRYQPQIPSYSVIATTLTWVARSAWPSSISQVPGSIFLLIKRFIFNCVVNFPFFPSIYRELIWMPFLFRWAVSTYYVKKRTSDAEVMTWLSRICCPIITSTRNLLPLPLSSQQVNLSLVS